MYSRQEKALMRKNFWTSFGQYMRPLAGAEGDQVNWLNYKTGIRHIYFRMDVNDEWAGIAIELRHPDNTMREHFYKLFEELKMILKESTGEDWQWQFSVPDEDGRIVSRIGTSLEHVNLFRKEDWPAIISFFKPRILALDAFWQLVKDRFEMDHDWE